MSARELIILGSSSQQPTRYRNHGAYLFRWNGQGLLFDPGEGTQRQFIFADVPPPCVSYIFISHFHGDHCLGLGSFLMRLNLDKVETPIHCFYPASGKVYFDRLRYGTIYHETIHVVEHPIDTAGVVYQDEHFTVEADFLEHGVDCLGYRVTEPDERKFYKDKLAAFGVKGPLVRELEKQGELEINGKCVRLDEVSYVRKGDSIAVISDTLFCPQAVHLARGARLLICESTFMQDQADLARRYKHMTAAQAAKLAKQAEAKALVLTHFSGRYLDSAPFKEEARAIFPETECAEDFKRFTFPKEEHIKE